MRTLRPSLVGTVLLMLAIGLSGAAAAQSDAVAEPTGAADLPVIVTGTESCGPHSGETTRASNGAESHRGLVGPCTDRMSDPRVSGTFTNTFNSQCFSPSSKYPSEDCVFWGTHVLTGADGGWDCTWQGVEDPSGRNWGLIFATCPGTGPYEGLTYLFVHVFGGAEDFGDGTSFHGIIYEGPLPGQPWPMTTD